MIRRGIAIVSLAVLANVAFAGCYTYRPATRAQIAPQERVRVTVTSAKQAELAEVLHRSSPSFAATYLEAGNGELLFSVPLRNPTPGMRTTTLRNRISIAPADVLQIETRELSTWRTAALVGAIAAGVSTAAAVALEGGNNTGEGGKRGGVDNNRIPLLRWRLPIGR